MNDSRAVDTAWVRGRAIERRKRSLVLACLDATLNERRLILPRSQLSGEREVGAGEREFCVPAWWAKAASVHGRRSL